MHIRYGRFSTMATKYHLSIWPYFQRPESSPKDRFLLALTMVPISLRPQVWLITGCSSGFGFEMTKQLLKSGDKVIATARKIDTIKPLEDLGAKILQLDVTASLGDLKARLDQAISFYGRIDVFFANAGIYHYSPVEDAESVPISRRTLVSN